MFAGIFFQTHSSLLVADRKADKGLNNLIYIKRDFCAKIVMKNVIKLRIKAQKTYFKRKVDSYLRQWKEKENRLPLIIKGARQIGKTESIIHFADENYENVVSINFVLEGQYKTILSDGYSVENIIKIYPSLILLKNLLQEKL